MKTYLIVGAGPAGLSAAAAISSEPNAKIFVIDTGSDLLERNHENADDLGCGVGGAGLFSDGKFSYYPSGTKLYDLPHQDAVQKSYEWVANVLGEVGIESQPFPKNVKAEKLGMFSIKGYTSSYGSLEQRRMLIKMLVNINNCEFILNTKVSKIVKKKNGQYSVITKSIKSVNSKPYLLNVDNIILATGRLGTLEFHEMLGDRWFPLCF
jgi:uncharacterized FAD-dependent dehydrogenase